jgi:hypothetical protein
MDTIVAGRFENFRAARQAEAALVGSDVNADDICTFALNPPGQHAAFPIGGDEYADAGARQGGTGAAKGAALGGTLGLGAGAVITAAVPEAPVTAVAVAVATTAVGAYTGSLVGALNGMGDDTRADDNAGQPKRRKAGVIVATRVADEATLQTARQALQETGAQDIEIANGTWRAGEWVDFDPTVPPVLVK